MFVYSNPLYPCGNATLVVAYMPTTQGTMLTNTTTQPFCDTMPAHPVVQQPHICCCQSLSGAGAGCGTQKLILLLPGHLLTPERSCAQKSGTCKHNTVTRKGGGAYKHGIALEHTAAH
jgi:hypothetical protein